MRRVIAVAALAAIAFFFWQNEGTFKVSVSCEEPVAYAVGVFDRRFGLSYQEFLGVLSEAEAVWEGPSGLDLFAYVSEADSLPINLVYDYRQEATQTLFGLESVVEEDETLYRELEAKYKKLKAEYEALKNNFVASVAAFNKEQGEYEDRVGSWNRGPKTSKAQFAQLEQMRAEFKSKAAELEARQRRLNDMVDEINALAERLNQLARSLNLNVEAYNAIGTSRGETFTGGIFYSAEGQEGIDIYEFNSRGKLVRILAHEFGHALGLEHLDDPEAIMYHLNESDNGALANSDLVALRELCRVE